MSRIRSGACKGRLLPHATASANLSMVLGRYEPEIQKVLVEQCRDCTVAYDIGAHVGFFTLLLANQLPGGIVYAFEPSPNEADRIEELIECNGFADSVRLQRLALCDEIGPLTFYAGTASYTGILEKASKPQQRERQAATTVNGTTLDEFVFGMGNDAPDLMKVDVEAAEASVMRGATRLLSEKRPKMLIEVHGPNACRDTIEAILTHDYQIKSLGPSGTTEVTDPDQLRNRFSKGKWTNHLLALP